MSTDVMTKEMSKIQKLSKSIRESEKIDHSKAVQVPPLEVGDIFAQGDIALTPIESLPSGSTVVEWLSGDFQLAPGTTRGSRHCIPNKFKSTIRIHRIDDGDVLSDLLVEASSPFDLFHPEHANHLNYPSGLYRVVHQQNEQMMRILD